MTNDYPFLFSKTRKVTFRWSSSQSRFVFSNSGSQVSQNEFESAYQERSWSEENILKYNLVDFKKIASGIGDKRKAWLRDFVSGCKDTPEKAVLVQALGQ